MRCFLTSCVLCICRVHIHVRVLYGSMNATQICTMEISFTRLSFEIQNDECLHRCIEKATSTSLRHSVPFNSHTDIIPIPLYTQSDIMWELNGSNKIRSVLPCLVVVALHRSGQMVWHRHDILHARRIHRWNRLGTACAWH